MGSVGKSAWQTVLLLRERKILAVRTDLGVSGDVSIASHNYRGDVGTTPEHQRPETHRVSDNIIGLRGINRLNQQGRYTLPFTTAVMVASFHRS